MYVVHDGVWSDATVATGAITPGLRWVLAEGAVGMTLGYLPYILIANPNARSTGRSAATASSAR